MYKKYSISHFQFPISISHSPFPIPHSPFPIPHFPFPILVTSYTSIGVSGFLEKSRTAGRQLVMVKYNKNNIGNPV